MLPTFALRVASVLGFLGVALGAFGAHALKELLITHGRVDDWKTATLYHLVHAVVIVALSRSPRVSAAAVWLFTTGIIIFSGSLYILCVTNVRWLGAITPIGGLCLLAGWLVLIIRPSSSGS